MGGRAVVAGAATALLLAACTGTSAEPEVATATVPVATPAPSTPSPSPTPDDPYAVPDEIDEAYLNRVFEALEQVIGDATRLIVAQKTYPPEADDLLMEVYGPDALQVVRDGWIDELLMDRELDSWADPPADKRVTVREIVHADRHCVFVETAWELEGVLKEPAPETIYLVLMPADPGDANPTPWRIERQARLAEGESAEGRNLCAP